MSDLAPLLTVLVTLLGLAVGSFLNVVIWRLPRRESLSSPASACPKCGQPIRPRDNMPVVSWLILRGRCRDCGAPISARYPAIELLTGALFAAVALRFGFDGGGAWAIPAFLYLAAAAVALAFIDIDTHTLPNRIVLPSLAVGLVLLAVASAATGDWGSLLRASAGAAILFTFYLVLALAYPKGMGLGDVKLAAVLGLYLGWLGWGSLLIGAFAAFLLGGIYAIALIISRRATRSSGIPFGPWMLAGAWVGIFFGAHVFSAYLALFGLD
jgi:leader peptidase (prepilin peptidase)/N-methyltransferase